MSAGGGFASNEITRRTFLKRSGGATVATLVAWNLASQQAARAETGEGSGSGSDSAPPSKPELRTYTRTLLISGTDANGNYTFTADPQAAQIFGDDNLPDESKVPNPTCNPPTVPSWQGANMAPLQGGQKNIQTHKNASADSPKDKVSQNGSVSGNNVDGSVKAVQVIVTYKWTYP